MNQTLRIELKAGGDGAGELLVSFRCEHCSGHGAAWFDLASLMQYLERFLAFPIDPGNLPLIEGGIWNSDLTSLKHELVHLSVAPLGSVGDLIFKVRVATDGDSGMPYENLFTASASFVVKYAQLADFVKEMRRLVAGEVPEVEMEL